MSFSVSRIGRNLLRSSNQLKQVMHSLAKGAADFINSRVRLPQGQIKRDGWGSRYYIWPGEGGEMKIENCK